MSYATFRGRDEQVTILHLDTDPEVIDGVERFLARTHDDIEVISAATPADALDQVREGRVDCVLCGTTATEMDALAFLRSVREYDSNVPFIFYRQGGSEEFMMEAVAGGSDDVIEVTDDADRTELLAGRIRSLVRKHHDRRRLAESRRRFETLVSNLPGMAYRCTNEPDWPMAFVSDGCRDLTGYAPEALVDGDVSYGDDVIVPRDRDRVWRTVQSAVAAGEQFRTDYQIATAAGDRRWVLERGQPVSEEGETVALEGFVTDVSEDRRQNRRIGLLNRVLRHNLRNNMNVLLGHAEELAADDAVPDTPHVDGIRETAREVAALGESVGHIDEILTADRTRCRPVALDAAVAESVDRLRSAHPRVEVTTSVEAVWVRGTDELGTALFQALENAVVHNDAAQPTVSVRTADAAEDGHVRLEIVDDGPGIPEMELDALDDRESISDLSHGSGLGLWVMKWYAESVGGDLAFTQHDSEGTTVAFRFRVADSPPEQSAG